MLALMGRLRRQRSTDLLRLDACAVRALRFAVKLVQTVAWKTSRPDEMRAVADRFWAENPDPGPGFLGLKMLKDRDRANSYLVVAEFESYDLAMQNSVRGVARTSTGLVEIEAGTEGGDLQFRNAE